MEQKTKALKTSSKVISVIMKIGYIAMIVALCICAASLIFIAATGGKTSINLGDTTIGISDATVLSTEVIAMYVLYFIISAFLLAIFFLAQKVFGEISVSGEPFLAKYAKYVRIIGILIVVMTVVTGLTDMIISLTAKVGGLETYYEAPGIIFGAVIFCLSYIIDYGCGLKERRESENADK